MRASKQRRSTWLVSLFTPGSIDLRKDEREGERMQPEGARDCCRCKHKARCSSHASNYVGFSVDSLRFFIRMCTRAREKERDRETE